MKSLSTVLLFLAFLSTSTVGGKSKISGFAGLYRGRNENTQVFQFKASPLREQGGIRILMPRLTWKLSFRDSDFFYKSWDDFGPLHEAVGTATIRRGVIRFQGPIDSGGSIKGMVRRTPYGLVISKTQFLPPGMTFPDGSTSTKDVLRLNRV